MKRILASLIIGIATVAGASDRLPIIDMHMHALRAEAQGPPPLAMCTPMKMPIWDPAKPYGAVFMELFKQPSCDDPVWSPETDAEVRSQTIEIMNRRNIIEPNDERMEPYWSLAEELDLPVGIHIGTGPPGVIYLGSSYYRARMHSPLTLEEVLVRHPRLRVYIMHAGFPMLDDLLALMYAHPQVYVEVGVIVYTQPRPAFYRYLNGITDAGFGDRVMFGSDQMVWPGTIERAIQVIDEAPFLSSEQKRNILYNNAARFLRLTNEEIERHHGM